MIINYLEYYLQHITKDTFPGPLNLTEQGHVGCILQSQVRDIHKMALSI